MAKTVKKILSKSEIEHLAKLSSLNFAVAPRSRAGKEEEKIADQLSDTLDYVKNLDELNTEKVSPTSHVADTTNVTFADGVKNDRGLSSDEATRLAGQKKNGYFSTKRILDKDAQT